MWNWGKQNKLQDKQKVYSKIQRDLNHLEKISVKKKQQEKMGESERERIFSDILI